MEIKLNLKGGFKTVQEGERVLEITKAECTPSGAPQKLVLNMKDVEDGASLINTYKFDNSTSVWAMGMMLNIALGLEDGATFNTKDAKELEGVKLVCEITHSEYNGKTYANVKRVISKVDETTGVVNEEPQVKKEEMSTEELMDLTRSVLYNDDDLS